LKESELDFKDIDFISYAKGPGLPNCLQVGAIMARYLAFKYKKKLVPVNHCIAHIEVGKLTTDCKDPVVLYCSGGNTQVIAFTEGRYRIFGETEDIPVGNALDVLARHIGLEMPGGPKIGKLAEKGKYVELPYVVKGMDLSFSGILTECKKLHNKGVRKEDIAFGLVETCFSMLTEVTERALAHTNKKEVLLVGGVAAAPRLKEMVGVMCKERGAKCFSVQKEYSGDNGIMIAWNGILDSSAKNIKDYSFDKDWRTDEVSVNWI
jgi:glycoprotease/Kae1 family metallohydrolase